MHQIKHKTDQPLHFGIRLHVSQENRAAGELEITARALSGSGRGDSELVKEPEDATKGLLRLDGCFLGSTARQKGGENDAVSFLTWTSTVTPLFIFYFF